MLFDRCLDSTQDHEEYLSKWFLNAPVSAIKRENVKEFLRWAFLSTDVTDPSYDDELESYVKKLEGRMGTNIPPGRAEVKCLRLSLDKVNALHRSLIWYMCIFVVDALTHVYLRFHNFRFYRASVSHSMTILPPRPHAFVASQRSPSQAISYWYRPHTSTTKLPILFLHGIGVGLYPYKEFLKEVNQGRCEEGGQVGILAVEILCISSRLTSPMLPKAEMCRQLRDILDQHQFHKFVLVSHSYGSVIATHLLKTLDLAPRISSIVLVDPVSILLNQPDVAYNFTVRKPRFANEWLLWYFGSKDIGVAHTLSRTFFWSENIIWKEDVLDHRCIVFLAEKDSIINSAKVLSYLQKDLESSGDKSYTAQELQRSNVESLLKVVWCPNLDHGQVFDLPGWRARLRSEILREAWQMEGMSQ